MQIDLIERDTAPDLVRHLYDGMEHAGRQVGNFYKVLAHKPHVPRTYLQRSGAVMAERTLPLKLKEPAYLYEPPSSTGAPIERARTPVGAQKSADGQAARS
jgi:hypothetical protein